MVDLDFAVEGAEAARHTATPTLLLKLRLTNTTPATPVQNVMLQCQIRIEPTRRHYVPNEHEPLSELFGPPDRWGATLHSTLWTHLNVLVPQLLWRRACRRSALLLFVLSLVVNIGMWMERVLIVVSSLHRDYLPSSWGYFIPTAWDWAFLAMAQHRLGHADEARRCLIEAARWIDEANRDDVDEIAGTRPVWGNWHERVVYPLLLRQADSLVHRGEHPTPPDD